MPPHAQGQPPPLAKPQPRALDNADCMAAEIDARVFEPVVEEASDGGVFPDDHHAHVDRVSASVFLGQDQVAARPRMKDHAGV